MTYSIVACDLERREWGVGVQSKFLAVGSLVPWVEAEVGAVATQAHANVRYGPDGLAMLRQGFAAEEVVAALTDGDTGRDHRQLGVVDSEGGSATYTGAACLEWAGGRDRSRLCGAGQHPRLTGDGRGARAHVRGDAPAGLWPSAFWPRWRPPSRPAAIAGVSSRPRSSWPARVEATRASTSPSTCAPTTTRSRSPSSRGSMPSTICYFGETPADEWLPVGSELADELRERLARLGHATGDLASDLATWAGIENLEMRVQGAERIDPVVLRELRALPRSSSRTRGHAQRSPGSRAPAARSRSAGTGSASGRATSSTAP